MLVVNSRTGLLSPITSFYAKCPSHATDSFQSRPPFLFLSFLILRFFVVEGNQAMYNACPLNVRDYSKAIRIVIQGALSAFPLVYNYRLFNDLGRACRVGLYISRKV